MITNLAKVLLIFSAIFLVASVVSGLPTLITDACATSFIVAGVVAIIGHVVRSEENHE